MSVGSGSTIRSERDTNLKKEIKRMYLDTSKDKQAHTASFRMYEDKSIDRSEGKIEYEHESTNVERQKGKHIKVSLDK